MSTLTKTLKDINGNLVAPRTYASAVKYDGTSSDIKTVIDGKIKNGTGTLTVVGWNDTTKLQVISVTGVTASNALIVSAVPNDITDYADAGIICTEQGAGTLTFKYTTKPTKALSVNVLILN